MVECVDKLANKPSELIRRALADLCKVEESPLFVVDMNTWLHRDKQNEPCHVCLAGAAIAGPYGLLDGQDIGKHVDNRLIVRPKSMTDAEYDVRLDRYMFPLKTFRKMEFLDECRSIKEETNLVWLWNSYFGRTDIGISGAGVYLFSNEKVPSYSFDAEGFHAALSCVADLYDSIGY